ncbi:hypothetical protein Malapachy_3552 [Malassezia pachydermatis]|uniref:Mitochondrial carrier n=1 Tax=Malassezia pachydermatis TaxID=77020 RepID=A0A0M8MXE7_9BASI|nr:hypothetical protein Malapachy_3552 [Malassezia pachydermatis]KOS16264.1 hypothetical protein Malapachy_3552 [Malassezia pachydermatis]
MPASESDPLSLGAHALVNWWPWATDDEDDDESEGHANTQTGVSRRESAAGAAVRVLVSSLAVLFQRPVRLFRPMHFSSLSLLDMLARREGKKLGVPFLRRLVRQEKPAVLLALIAPPMLANLAIGFTLFQTYTLTEKACTPVSHTSDMFKPTWTVAVAGAAAGAAQCIISAPLDNVRLVIQPWLVQDATRKSLLATLPKSPFHAWSAMVEAAFLPFLPERWYRLVLKRMERAGRSIEPKTSTIFRYLPRDLRLLARRKHGVSLLLSLVRDAAGFSCFFVTFEWARRVAFRASLYADQVWHWARRRNVPIDAQQGPLDQSFGASRTVGGRMVAALLLVTGGAVGALLYSWVCRPIEYVRVVLWHRLYVPQTKPHAPAADTTQRHVAHIAPHRKLAAIHNVRAVRVRQPVPRISYIQAHRHLRTQRRRIPRWLYTWTQTPWSRATTLRRRTPSHGWWGQTTVRKLMRFARMTAPPTLLTSPMRLFVHTYLVRPFTHPALCKASAPRPWGTAPPVRHAALVASPTWRGLVC